MTLPNFLIIGAQKAGTTWIAKNLVQHPDVFIPSNEIHFFNQEKNFNRGIDWYKKQFIVGENTISVGEKTPNYLWVTKSKINSRFGNHLPLVNQKIFNYLPDVKIIVILRDPVKRLISALNHYRRIGQLSPLCDPDSILLGNKKYIGENFGLINMGLYCNHLEAYYNYFGSSQILILIYEEDIVQNPDFGLKKVCKFLGINSAFTFEDLSKKTNSFSRIRLGNALINHFNPYPKNLIIKKFYSSLRGPMMGPRIKKRYPSKKVTDILYKMYEKENDKLFELLGRRIDLWQVK